MLSQCAYNTNNSNQPMRFNVNLTNGSISQSVWTLKVNPITGTARVRWFASPLTEYRHTGVSRRAILGLLIGGDRSYGQWVNHNCLQSHQREGLGGMWRKVSERMAVGKVSTV